MIKNKVWMLFLLINLGNVAHSNAESIDLGNDSLAVYEQSFDRALLPNTVVRILQAGKTNSQSVLLVHGLGENGLKDWQNVIPQLAKEFHVIALDLPGFGQSELNREIYAPEHFSELLHLVKQKYAKSKLIVIGHSLGGAISLKYVDLYPQDLNRLVLVSVAGVLQRGVYMRFLSNIAIEPDNPAETPTGFIQSALGLANGLSSTVIEVIDKLPQIESLVVNNWISRDYLFADQQMLKSSVALIATDFSSAIANIQVPTHIIWGAQDPVASLRVAKVLSLHISQSTLDIIPQAQHVPMSTHQNQFNQLLSKRLHQVIIDKKATMPIEAPRLSLQNLQCDEKDGLRFTGIFNEIILNECTNIKLEKVYANRVVMKNSSVTFDQISIVGSDFAMNLHESKMTGNNLMLKAKTPLILDNSWVDIAGGYLIGEKNIVETDGESKMYFSVSRGTSNNKTFSLHGEYDDETNRL